MHIRRLAAAVTLAALCGCRPAAPDPSVPEGVSLSFIQQRIDEGTDRAQLRVVNHGDTALRVTGLGLDWAGYGPAWVDDYETTVEPGRTLDLRMLLPEPDCTADPGRPTGLLRVEQGTVRGTLDESGTGFLTRMWARRCADLTVGEAVRVEYGERWRVVGQGFGAKLVGTLELTRQGSADDAGPIAVPDLQGSVLFTARLPERVVLPPGQTHGSFPLELTAGRCDDHGLSQSSQTFYFRVSVRLGAGPPLRVIRIPDLHTQARSQHLLEVACPAVG